MAVLVPAIHAMPLRNIEQFKQRNMFVAAGQYLGVDGRDDPRIKSGDGHDGLQSPWRVVAELTGPGLAPILFNCNLPGLEREECM